MDIILCAYNDQGKVVDFGALEIQAVYISGNVHRPFEYFMEKPDKRNDMDWEGEANYPRPDYLSSSRKRLAPQLIFKGGIFKAWGKKSAVALNKGFFDTLPELEMVAAADADIACFVYDLVHDKKLNVLKMLKSKTVYTKFNESLEKITRSEAGNIGDFMGVLQDKVDEKLENNPPVTRTIDAPF